MASGWSLASLESLSNNTVKHTISTNIYTRNIKPNRNRSQNVCYRGRGNIWGQRAEPENPERGGTPMYTY